MSGRGVLLDRDGTIVEGSGFLRSPGEVALLPGVAAALRDLASAGFRLAVVTNQSAIARGLLEEATLERIHERLGALLRAQGGPRLDRIYACPHHPEEGRPPYRVACECRKPRPGLLLRALRELDLDAARSFSVGDAPRDLEAALAAGVRFVALRFSDPRASHEAPDLPGAASWILEQDQGR
ncbi:MAG TPA: HAD family hydrolase [Planctomycetota bacterium]|jgi:D-glycero-D-manno-heptose 1,7-bisphosphate phosphatase|nr:HAD family hydrolase [Planctomycetota bacterium]